MTVFKGEGQSAVLPNFYGEGIPPSVLGDSTAATVTSSAAELNVLDGITASTAELNKASLLASADRAVKIKKVALAAVDTAGGLFAFTPGAAAIITGLYVDVTTKTTGACTMDCGVATNGTTLSDTLIDGKDINAAAGLFSNKIDYGTNGKAVLRCGATQYVTGSVASGASAGIVGFAYIEYVLI